MNENMNDKDAERTNKHSFLADVKKAMSSGAYPEESYKIIEDNVQLLMPYWHLWEDALGKAKDAINKESSSNLPIDLERASLNRFRRTGKKLILGIVGAAGSGKDTVAKAAGLPNRVLQTTTRKPRPGEVNGADYEFLTESKFDESELFFTTDHKPGRGRYGFRLENLDKGFVDGTAVVIQSAKDSIKMCKSYSEIRKDVDYSIIYVIPGEPVFAHLALRYTKRLIENGGDFESGIEGTLGLRNVDEFNDAISIFSNGDKVVFLVNDNLQEASDKLKNILHNTDDHPME